MEFAYSAGLSAAGALALGVPLRLFGWRATWGAVLLVWRTLRGYRWWILLILLAGAAFGLWRLEDVRELIFGLF
ncbi:MAG: hypothetical protein NXI12_06390 [Alphaproteobacteria bacterium]|nr:hypothetical protein [Alphaproteobacteria bacterium]